MLRKYKTIIVEDEAPARNRLKRLLADYSNQIEIVAEAENGQEGIKLIEELHPDLVFLDIQMPMLNGFEMLMKLSYTPLIIFITAYEAFAIKAFEENATDYLLKPIEPARLALTMKKLEKMEVNSPKELMRSEFVSLFNQLQNQKMTSIPVRIGDRIILIKPEEISFFEAKEKYVFIHTIDGQEHLIDFTLSSLEEKLPAQQFIRVHRAFIVNKSNIREVKRYFTGKYLLLMNDKANTKVETGSNYAEAIKTLITF